MSSALDALLEAARYIELQEQHGFRDGWIPPPLNTNSSSSSISSSSSLSSSSSPSSDLNHNTGINHLSNGFRQNSSSSINNHHVITNNSNNTNNNISSGNHRRQNNHQHGITEYNNSSTSATTEILRKTENSFISNNQNHRNNINNHNNNNSNGNIKNSRIISPTVSPTNGHHLPMNAINIKTFNTINSNNQNELKHLHHDDRGIDNVKNLFNNNIEIITNGVGRQRHNSSSSNSKTGLNLNINNNIITTPTNNGSAHPSISTTTEDSSQSSLNLSTSSYLSGSPNNNHNSSSSNINSDQLLPFQLTSSANVANLNNNNISIAASSTGNGRRRTISNTSDGSRNSSSARPGTREIHNKLEKHRRAHLKECFEQLKIQLQLKDEEKKKTSNLAILGAAYRHVMALRRKERELEQQVELLAKEKINAQKKIVSLKRELAAKYDNIDFTSIVSDVNNVNGSGAIVSTNTTNVVNSTTIQQTTKHTPPPTTQSSHQVVPLNLNRTSSPQQTLLLSPNNNTNSKLNHSNNNDVIMSTTTTSSIISKELPHENNKNSFVMQNGNSGRKLHHQPYTTEKPRDLSMNSSQHKIVLQSNNNNSLKSISPISTSSTTITAASTLTAPPTVTTGPPANLNIKDDPDHPKIMKSFSLIALAPVDKDNKIISSTSLPIPQVVTANGGLVIPMLSSQALRVIGPNNLPTIEFNPPALQNHLQNGIPSALTSNQQLQKLFINGDCNGATTITAHHPALTAATVGNIETKNGITNVTEINRLPGGAELNILPASVAGGGTTTLYRGNEKLTFVNNSITLKSTNAGINGITSGPATTINNNSSSRGGAGSVHVINTTSNQNIVGGVSNTGCNTTTAGNLTPIVVTQGQQVNNITQLIANTQQLGKMNISVNGHHHHPSPITTTSTTINGFINGNMNNNSNYIGGGGGVDSKLLTTTQLFNNSTHYIHPNAVGTMKQMVVAVANNATPTNNNIISSTTIPSTTITTTIQTAPTTDTIGKI